MVNFKSYLLKELFKILPSEKFGDGFKFSTENNDFIVYVDQTSWKGNLAFEVNFAVIKDGEEDYKTTLSHIGKAEDATDIVSTVVDIAMREALGYEKDVFWLVFSPIKDENIGEKSKRGSLYSRLIKRMAKNYGYELNSVQNNKSGDMGFLLVK